MIIEDKKVDRANTRLYFIKISLFGYDLINKNV
jgi:hypothetical protein